MLMLALLAGWSKLPLFKIQHLSPEIKFSIVIPYRNEANNLPALLDSLFKLRYPHSHFEILLVNDASEDISEQICLNFIKSHPKFPVFLLNSVRISGSPKKDAISTAIESALFDYIITTDADCLVPAYWLQVFNEKLLKSGAALLAGPVNSSRTPVFSETTEIENSDPEDEFSTEGWEVFREKRSLKYFHFFQELDFLSLQAAGAGGFGLQKAFMCNGANLCYSRAAFYEVDGFSGNGDISSGDDVFLLQKFVKHKYNVVFLKAKEAIIQTKPQPNLVALISQRIRWASKTPAYSSWFAKLTGLTVLLMNLSLILGVLLVAFHLIPYQPLLMAFFFKFLVDFFLLYKSALFFERKDILRNYFWSSLIYPFFSTSIAILSLFKKFEWKGRVLNK